jgi:hypothetical protein
MALPKIDVTEEGISSIITVKIIIEHGIMLAVSLN